MDEDKEHNENSDMNQSSQTENSSNSKSDKREPNIVLPQLTLEIPDNFQQATARTQTQFTIENLNVSSPTANVAEMTPSDVQAQNTNQTKTRIGWCDGCCTSVPIRIAPSRVGPVSEYSIKNKCAELLPPRAPNDNRITLVLDLDETLVHSSFVAIPHSDFSFILGVDMNKLGVYVCVRPGAQEFLDHMSKYYELILFTASSQFYADTVIDHIDPNRTISYRLYRESCTDFSGCFVKDLSKLNRDIDKIIIIDNSSVAYLLQPSNAIAIESWYDDPTDTQLIEIEKLLDQNHDATNVYDILVNIQK